MSEKECLKKAPLDRPQVLHRLLTPADIDACMEVDRTLGVSTWTLDQYRRSMRVTPTNSWPFTMHTRYVGAFVGGSLCGYVSLRVTLKKNKIMELFVENIAVSRDHQRSGIGQFLMQKMMDLAKEFPDTPIVLYVRAENAAAIALYSRFEFHITNTEEMVGNYAPEKSGKALTYEMTHHRK